MKKKKEEQEYMRQIRKVWGINPITRIVQDSRKNKKKRRQEENKIKKDIEE